MGRPPDPTRYDEVLTGTVAYLADHGLSNLSMRKLAAAMGTSTNTLSYQFGSREALIEAALERARTTTLAVLEEIRARPEASSAADGIAGMWEWWLQDRRNLVSTRLSIEALTSTPQDLPPERRPALLGFWIDYFATWIEEDGQDDREAAVQQSTLLMALLSGLVIDLYSTNDRSRIESSLHAYLSAWPGRPAR